VRLGEFVATLSDLADVVSDEDEQVHELGVSYLLLNSFVGVILFVVATFALRCNERCSLTSILLGKRQPTDVFATCLARNRTTFVRVEV
jgi:hypothetical protein